MFLISVLQSLISLVSEPEMASTAVYLATATFTNGIILRADGGHNLVNP